MTRYISLILIFIYFPVRVSAQGCADAGFCSVGAMQTGAYQDATQKEQNTVGISTAVASGEKLAWIISPQLEIKIFTPDKSYFEVKLPYHIISGNLGTNLGIGDLITTYTAPLAIKNQKLKLQYTVGTRIGLGNADDNINGKPLPMAYQLSTGTTDLILGMAANLGRYLVIAAGIQQPLIQYNRNGYFTTENRDSVKTAYYSSFNLRRRGDALLRVDARKDWKHTGIHGGALLLYHLGEDRSRLKDGTLIALPGSSGITINLNFTFYYSTAKWMLDFTLAAPVHARENRPDSLTRNAIVIPRLIFKL